MSVCADDDFSVQYTTYLRDKLVLDNWFVTLVSDTDAAVCGGRAQLFRGRCGVRFYDLQSDAVPGPGPPGEFEQQVTIEDFYHEKIEVPSIGDTRRATVLHDFNRVRHHVILWG